MFETTEEEKKMKKSLKLNEDNVESSAMSERFLTPAVSLGCRFACGGAEQSGEPEQQQPGLPAEQTGHQQRTDHRVLPGGLQEERPHLPLLRPTPSLHLLLLPLRNDYALSSSAFTETKSESKHWCFKKQYDLSIVCIIMLVAHYCYFSNFFLILLLLLTCGVL